MKSNIIADYEMIQRTSFWNEYVTRLGKYSEQLKRDLITRKEANLDYYQGAYAALTKVILTPDEIIRAEADKSKSAPKPDNLGKGPGSAD